ncbi:hypothetical protein SAMN02983003_0527 [Devosia enhydra]|uniref:Uncharacterized protein n=1 Tax=Devosia enhydra TaxID=665118 RepID=A0A1K2HTJ1_9HYPH|nr:hypothetical protein [Devosia enhydra]SFZ81488.1 hypothetical protein SAMN02983003_0527 [Devosia enhydra]
MPSSATMQMEAALSETYASTRVGMRRGTLAEFRSRTLLGELPDRSVTDDAVEAPAPAPPVEAAGSPPLPPEPRSTLPFLAALLAEKLRLPRPAPTPAALPAHLHGRPRSDRRV